MESALLFCSIQCELRLHGTTTALGWAAAGLSCPSLLERCMCVFSGVSMQNEYKYLGVLLHDFLAAAHGYVKDAAIVKQVTEALRLMQS